ncbi:MAG: hypothetical protein O8C61_11475 [Candidatus Methanoperedens sp.]|nr:hypothetical protein [Candidatus Methanoperedens sp.]
MVNIEAIPIEGRWIIAAKSAGMMPLLYDKVFRKALGEKYDEMKRPILIEAGKEMKDIAMALGLPSGNARQIVETVGILSTISFGPENKYEPVVETEHGAMGKMTECAIRNSAIQMGLDPKIAAMTACRTMMRSVVESLNPDYTLKKDTKNMCSGDEYCEMVVERQR